MIMRTISDWLLVKVLCRTQYKIGHFGDIPQDKVLASQSLGLMCQNNNLTQQKHTFTNQKKCTTRQNKHKK